MRVHVERGRPLRFVLAVLLLTSSAFSAFAADATVDGESAPSEVTEPTDPATDAGSTPPVDGTDGSDGADGSDESDDSVDAFAMPMGVGVATAPVAVGAITTCTSTSASSSPSATCTLKGTASVGGTAYAWAVVKKGSTGDGTAGTITNGDAATATVQLNATNSGGNATTTFTASLTVTGGDGSTSTGSVDFTCTRSGNSGNRVFTCQNLTSNTDLALYFPTPTVTATPTSGPRGTTITLAGTGFYYPDAASVAVAGQYNGITLNPQLSCSSDPATGGFTGACSFVVPAVNDPVGRSPLGSNAIRVVAGTGVDRREASTNFRAFDLTATPSSGVPGTSVTIASTGGFPSGSNNAAVTATLGGVTVISSGCSAAAAGTFSGCTFTVPEIASGATTLAVTLNSFTGSIPFTVNAPPAPAITLTPSSGAEGTSVTIAGTNFGITAGRTPALTFAGAAWSPTAACTTTSAGAFSCTAVVPAGATLGAATVTATVTGTSVTFTDSETFTVLAAPTLAVDPTSGQTGATITLTGTNLGATAGATVTATLGATALTLAATGGGACTTDAAGAFSCTFAVPALSPAIRSLTATASGVSASTSFEVLLSPPSVSTSVASAMPGTTVTLTGANFGSTNGAAVTATFASSALTLTATGGGSCTTDASGVFSCTFRVPDVAAGSYTIAVSASGETASTSFQVTALPAATATPSVTSGRVATSVSVTGANFGVTSGTTVTATFGGSALTLTTSPCTTSATGAFTCSFAVPAVTPSVTPYTVVLSAGAYSASFTFTVLPTPTLTLTPSVAQPGTLVDLDGTQFGFVSGVSLSATLTNVSTSASSALTLAGSCTTLDATGLVDGCWFAVPNVAAGTYRVDLTAGANTASATLRVVTLSASPTSGFVGATVTLTGAGFGPDRNIDVEASFGGAAFAKICTTGADGAISACTFELPNVTQGPYALQVRVIRGGVTYLGTVTVTVLPPAITVAGALDSGGDIRSAVGTPPATRVSSATGMLTITGNGLGKTASNQAVTVTFLPVDPVGPATSLALTGSRPNTAETARANRTVQLSWSGAAGPVDLYRDGKLVASGVASTAGAGTYADTFPEWRDAFASPYTYVACPAGATTGCSPEWFATTVFATCTSNNAGVVSGGCVVPTPYSSQDAIRVRIATTSNVNVVERTVNIVAPRPPVDIRSSPGEQTLIVSWAPSQDDTAMRTAPATSGYRLVVVLRRDNNPTYTFAAGVTPSQDPVNGIFDAETGRYEFELDTAEITSEIVCLTVASYSGSVSAGNVTCNTPGLRGVTADVECGPAPAPSPVYATDVSSCTVIVRDKINPKKSLLSVMPEGTVTWGRPAGAKTGAYVEGAGPFTEVAAPTCTLVPVGPDTQGREYATCSVQYRGDVPGYHDLTVAYTARRDELGVYERQHSDGSGAGDAAFRPRPPAAITDVTPGAQTLIVEWTPSVDEPSIVGAPPADDPVEYRVTALLPTAGETLVFPVEPGVAGGAFDDATGRYTFEVDTLDVAVAVCLQVEAVYEDLSSYDGTAPNLRQDCSEAPDARDSEVEVACEVVFVDDEAPCTVTVIDVINPAKTVDDGTYAPLGAIDWARRSAESKPGSFGSLDDELRGGLGATTSCTLEAADGVTDDGRAYSTCSVAYHSATVGWHLLRTTGFRPADVDRGDGLTPLPLHRAVTADTPARAGFDYRVTLSGNLARSGGVRVKAGSVVPLVFRLTTAWGAPVSSVTSVAVHEVLRGCDVMPTDAQRGAAATPLAVFAAGKSGLQNLGDGWYQINLKPSKTLGGQCVAYALALGDASTPAQSDPPAFTSPVRAQLVSDEVPGILGSTFVRRQFQLFTFTR